MTQGDEIGLNPEIFPTPRMGRLSNKCPIGPQNCCKPVAAMCFRYIPFVMTVFPVVILSAQSCILLGVLRADNQSLLGHMLPEQAMYDLKSHKP